MASWLDELVDQHKELESPKSFWKWSALAAISAVVKDNVWMNRQIHNLYPNIYVMLHAESGMKKGPPVSMAKQLVRHVNNTRIIGGRSSIQGILKEMGTAKTEPGGKINSKSVAFICSSELSSSIVEDKVATKILTDLYDRQYNLGEWKSLLKMEAFELKDPTVTMLTATNEAMSEDFFTKSAIQGGYFARTFIIYEAANQVNNSLIFPMESTPDYKAASAYLKELSNLSGAFEPLAAKEPSELFPHEVHKFGRIGYLNDAGKIYDDWYEEFRNNVKEMEDKDATGTMNRFGDSVLKIAMLLSLAEQPKLIITPHAMQTAIAECEKLLGNVRKTTLGKHGLSEMSDIKSMVIKELLERQTHQVSRTVLMKKMWGHYGTADEFDELMTSLHAAGIAQISNIGNNVLYTMPDNQVDELTRFFKGKSNKR